MIEHPEINNTLKKIAFFLQHQMTPQILQGLQKATDEIKAVIEHLDFNSTLALEQILSELQQTAPARTVNQLVNSARSLNELANIANEFAFPAKVFLYGAIGMLSGFALINLLPSQQKNQQKPYTDQEIDQFIRVHSLQLKIMQVQLQLNQTVSDRLHYPHTALETAEMLAETTLHRLYQEKLKDLSIEDYYDCMNEHRGQWNALVDHLPQHFSQSRRSPRPELSYTPLNYHQIKKRYDAQHIDRIMQQLVEGFYEQGGIHLYQCLARSTKPGLSMLAECIKSIPTPSKPLPEGKPWSRPLDSLHRYYHQQAPLVIEAEWQQMDYSFLPEEQQRLNPRFSHLLRLRALMTLAHRLAADLSYPHSIPMEIRNGIEDVSKGLTQLTCKPKVAMTCLAQTVFTLQGWNDLAQDIYYHPFRFLTRSIITSGLLGGLYALLSTPNHSAYCSFLCHHTGITKPSVSQTAAEPPPAGQGPQKKKDSIIQLYEQYSFWSENSKTKEKNQEDTPLLTNRHLNK